MDETFGKKEKLKSKILIKEVFTQGSSITKFPIKLIYLPLSTERYPHSLTAVSVPKRNFRKAVDRIHIKRLMREAYRKNKYLVSENSSRTYALMFLYIGKEKADYHKIRAVTEELLKRFIKKESK